MWRGGGGGVTLLNPKYPPGTAGGIQKNLEKDRWACAGEGGGGLTFDHTLEIIHIIWELRSQIPKSAPDVDIMRITAA